MTRVIADVLASFDGPPHLLLAVHGTADPERIAAQVDAFCIAHLHAGVAEHEFFVANVGAVHGLRLTDGRRVIVKVHQASVDVAYLQLVADCQRLLSASGFPCPAPLEAPARLAGGVATVEQMLRDGGRADGHDPRVRGALAATLVELIELLRPLAADPRLHLHRELLHSAAVHGPFPAPHDARFDFAACTAGTAWIDTLAAAARQRNDEQVGETVVGHTDWKVGHLRFDDRGQVVAVFDWDSLALTHEPAVVGEAAHAFCADWEAENYICTPTIDEALAFIADYEAARGRPFSAEEGSACHAAFVYACAYTARCEDSDARTGYGQHAAGPPPRTVPATSYRALLAEHGPRLLGVAPPAGLPCPR
jgi:aminoglycoside phosphotransferase (APT) family kinase protein